MKRFIAFLLLTVMLFSLVACDMVGDMINSWSADMEPINTEPESTTNQHSVELTMENYATYLDFSYNAEDATYNFAGVLSYAYYENVVITIEVPIWSYRTYEVEQTELYYHKLNAAGDGKIHLDDICKSLKIYGTYFTKEVYFKGISGKVILNSLVFSLIIYQRAIPLLKLLNLFISVI